MTELTNERSGLPIYGCTAYNSIKAGHEWNSQGICALCGDGPGAQPADCAVWKPRVYQRGRMDAIEAYQSVVADLRAQVELNNKGDTK